MEVHLTRHKPFHRPAGSISFVRAIDLPFHNSARREPSTIRIHNLKVHQQRTTLLLYDPTNIPGWQFCECEEP